MEWHIDVETSCGVQVKSSRKVRTQVDGVVKNGCGMLAYISQVLRIEVGR